MYWTLELVNHLEDAPWPATKDELIEFSIRTGTPAEVTENLQELEDDGAPYESIEEKMGLIAIHDGVRPFVTTKLLEKLFKEAELYGNAIPFTSSTNSLRKVEGNKNFAVDRSLYVQVQTPQVFKYDDIIKCLKNQLRMIIMMKLV